MTLTPNSAKSSRNVDISPLVGFGIEALINGKNTNPLSQGTAARVESVSL